MYQDSVASNGFLIPEKGIPGGYGRTSEGGSLPPCVAFRNRNQPLLWNHSVLSESSVFQRSECTLSCCDRQRARLMILIETRCNTVSCLELCNLLSYLNDFAGPVRPDNNVFRPGKGIQSLEKLSERAFVAEGRIEVKILPMREQHPCDSMREPSS